MTATDLFCQPLTLERWGDLEAVFGPERGGASGCWCMWFKLTRAEWTSAGKAGRKSIFRILVSRGPAPGLLGYVGGKPVAWVAVAPRDEQPMIERSKVTGPIDDRAAWAITCFYILPRWRRKGLMLPLVQAAVAFAREQGATLVEAYPSDPPPDQRKTGFIGIASAFRAAGFSEVARRSPHRPIMRLELGG